MEQEVTENKHTRPRILFADDHHVILDALTFVTNADYDVLAVDNLAAFEAAVESFSPDLAILDVRMPDGDGFEAAQKARENRPDLKIIFLSMYSDPKYVRRAADIGAQGYVSKRAPMEELLTAIRTVMNGGRYLGSRMQVEEPHLSPEGALTPRQVEVLRLISRGCSAKEIAGQLNISVRTAEFHRAAIMERLKLHSTAMMTRYAVERGIA